MPGRRQKVRSTVRVGPKVEHADHDDALSALLALRERLSAVGPREATSVFRREIGPEAQVAARGELRLPGRVHAGIDVRGDGSTEAWTGRWRRQVVAQEPGEDAYAALGRVLDRTA